MGKPRKTFSEAFKQDFLVRFVKSGKTLREFVKGEAPSYRAALEWVNQHLDREKLPRHHRGPYPASKRRQAVEAYLKSGLTQEDFCRTWGVTVGTLIRWVRTYQEEGPQGLEGYARAKKDDKRKGRKIAKQVLDEVVRIKTEKPQSGLMYIRQVMSRFKGVNISTGAIKKTLVEAEIPLVTKQVKRKRSSDKIRRFERALPMQLWQSDITSFVMTRHSQRVYLTVFMDDYSRYVVAWGLAVRQTAEFVSEVLLDGVSKFGKPEEVLTDQGRQYFAWRGKSDFQKILDREGIRHVVSRSHHPQTLGKCERFWETVGQEFWKRVKPQDLGDAKKRFAHFINHYNHFRPHQGIEGLAPADRFFGVASEVRKTMEEMMAENQLRLAIGEAPRSPVFLVGQIGDQPISLHGEGGKLVLSTAEGLRKEMSYGEFGHLKKGGDNGSEDGEEATWSQEGHGDAGEGAAAGEGSLAGGELGGEAERASNGESDSAVLAWAQNEERDCGGAEDSTAEDLAALGASDGGNDGGTVKAAETEERSSCEREQGRRSEVSEEEDCGARENGRFAEISNRYSEGDAGLQGCDDSGGRSGAGGTGEKAD
jgi:transposase InsO family protein/transposase-like protein